MFISRENTALFSLFTSSITFCSSRNWVVPLIDIIDHLLAQCWRCEVETFSESYWLHAIKEKIRLKTRLGFLSFLLSWVSSNWWCNGSLVDKAMFAVCMELIETVEFFYLIDVGSTVNFKRTFTIFCCFHWVCMNLFSL